MDSGNRLLAGDGRRPEDSRPVRQETQRQGLRILRRPAVAPAQKQTQAGPARCRRLKDTEGGSKAERKAIRCLMAERHRRESGAYATKDRTKQRTGTAAPAIRRPSQRR